MELQESREYKAAKELERALNDMSWNPQKFAESTRYYHRTLQQELMKTIVAIIKILYGILFCYNRKDDRAGSNPSHVRCCIFIFPASVLSCLVSP